MQVQSTSLESEKKQFEYAHSRRIVGKPRQKERKKDRKKERKKERTERKKQRKKERKNKKRRMVTHAHHTEVIASCSELLSLHCLRPSLLGAVLPPSPSPGMIRRQDCSAYAEEPLRTAGLLRGSSSVQFARLAWVCECSHSTAFPTQE